MQARERSIAYVLLRLAIGVNFAGHGFARFHIGLANFAQSTAEHFAKSPLPHGFVLGFLSILPIVESLVGVALILGIGTRFALILASLLMICLTAGVTLNLQFDLAGLQLTYCLVLFVLLFTTEYNSFSLDRIFRRP